MLIVVDINGKVIENKGTNSMYPDGNVPGIEPKEQERFVRLHDNSDFAKKIMDAYDYTLSLDENYEVIEVNVIKTFEELQLEEKIEQEDLSKLRPSEEAIFDSKVELKVIETLIELEVI